MAEMLPFLKSLLGVSGLSGYEGPAARLIEEAWRPLIDELHFSRLGSLHALKKGSGKSPRPALLAAVHMDSIGLMARKVQDGFIFVAAVGSVDLRVLPGTPVLVHAAGGDLPGVVVMPPAQLLPAAQRGRFPDLDHMLVDTGLTPAQVARRVRAGDLISVDTQPVELAGGTLSGHSLDNRASVAALTAALGELGSAPTCGMSGPRPRSQEETTFAGAATSAFQLKPDLAVIMDVTYAKAPGTGGWDSFPLGGGPTLGLGPRIHPFLHKRFKELAQASGMPFAVEPMPVDSLTDADAVQVTAAGIPCMVLGIPIRYMHTPVEVVCAEGHPARRPSAGRLHRLAGSRFPAEDRVGVSMLTSAHPSSSCLKGFATRCPSPAMRPKCAASCWRPSNHWLTRSAWTRWAACSSAAAAGAGTRPRVLLDAHMDEVGFMIVEAEGDGIYRFEIVGGIDTASACREAGSRGTRTYSRRDRGNAHPSVGRRGCNPQPRRGFAAHRSRPGRLGGDWGAAPPSPHASAASALPSSPSPLMIASGSPS